MSIISTFLKIAYYQAADTAHVEPLRGADGSPC